MHGIGFGFVSAAWFLEVCVCVCVQQCHSAVRLSLKCFISISGILMKILVESLKYLLTLDK